MRIVIFRDSNLLGLKQDELTLLESACRRIPGARASGVDVSLTRARGQLASLFRELAEESICVVPLDLPASRSLIGQWHKAIMQARPLPVLCAICFVLMPASKEAAAQWLDGFWIETLDEFTELAVPSSFVPWTDEDSRLKTFRMVSALSSQARELESLGELSRLDERIVEMEATMADLARRL